MFNWYHNLDNRERKTFYACFLGWATDAFDAQLFSFLIPTLIGLWAMTTAQAGWLGTSALISSAIGGWIAGILCDRFGRVPVMKLAIIWFTVFTIASGFANSFEQLLIARTLSGIGFGGEWAAGAVLIGETIRSEYRGKAVGTVQSAYAVGYGAAAIVSSLLFAALDPQIAWRWMFWLGAIPAVWVFLAMRGVKEPEVFVKSRKALAAAGTKVNPLAIFGSRHLKTTVLCSLLALGVQGGAFSILLWLPTLLKANFGLSTVAVGYYVFVLTFGSFIGYLVAAYLSDMIGRRRNFFLFTALNWITIPLFLYAPAVPALHLVLIFVLGFSLLGIYSALGPYFTELFPSAVRANGQAFSYNFGRAVGAFYPALIGVVSSTWQMPLREATLIAAMSAYVFVLLAVSMLPETNGRDLAEADADAEHDAPSRNGAPAPTA